MPSNTLPPGWEAKIDKKSGRTYYINHNDKTSTWDHPCSNKKSNSKVNGYPKQSGTEFIALQDFSSRTKGSPLTVKPKNQETHVASNSGNTDEAVAKIAAMFPTVSDAHIRLLMKNSRYMKSIFPKAEETLILEILSNHDNNIQKSSDKLRELGFEKKDSLKISQQKYQMQLKSEETNTEQPKSPAPIPKKKTSEEKAKMKSELQSEHKNIPEQLITIALESVDFDKGKASSLLKGTTQEESKTEEGKVIEFSEVDNQSAQKNTVNEIPVSMSRQSLKSLLKSEKTEKENVKIHRVFDSGNSGGYKSNNLSNVMGPNPALAKGNKENLLLEDYIKWQGPNPNHCKGAKAGLAKGPSTSNKIERRIEACGPNLDNRKGPNKNLVKGSIFNQMKATVAVGEESRGK